MLQYIPFLDSVLIYNRKNAIRLDCVIILIALCIRINQERQYIHCIESFVLTNLYKKNKDQKWSML